MSKDVSRVVFVFIVLIPNWTHAEVFSSVAQMVSLVGLESKLIDHLENILNVSRREGESGHWIDTIQRTLVCLKQRYSSVHQSPNLIHNPVAGFRFLRRLAHDWNHLTQTFSKKTDNSTMILVGNIGALKSALSEWNKWPGKLDTEGAALGLITIGQVYDLFPFPAWLHTNLTSSACFETMYAHNILATSFECLHRLLVDHREDQPARRPYLTQEGQKGINRSCDYSYRTLSGREYLLLSRVALKYQLNSQARLWFVLASSYMDLTDLSDRKLSSQVEAIKKQLLPRQDPSLLTDSRSTHDVTQAEYLRLCRRSIESRPPARVPTDQPGPALTCFWHSRLHYDVYKAETLHLSPVVMQFYDVISDREIEHVKDEARVRLSPSDLHVNSRTNNRTRLLRVSQTAWLPDSTAVIDRLTKRVGYVTGLETRQQTVDTPSEPFQVVNYGLGGLYVPHEDSVRIARNLGQEDVPQLRGAGDRLATWMFYSSAILWYNLKRNGEADPRMVHAGCPVLLGDKWVANKWIRERAQIFRYACSTDPKE